MRLKTLRVLTIALAIILAFSACGKGKNADMQNSDAFGNKKGVTIVTSFYPMYVFTKNITKDIPNITVINMTEPQTGCLHDYQLRPADMKLLEKAKIFVTNGAGMEGFIDKVIKQMPNLKVVEAAKGIDLLKDENGDANPHVWVSISGAIGEVKNIGEQLAAIDADNAENYKRNTQEYLRKLEVEKDKMYNTLKDIKNKDVVTFHEAFPYFAKEFGLNVVSVIEREPGSEPSAGELADTINKINEAKVKVLFAEPQYSAKAAETIAKETGAKVYILDPVVTGPKDADPDAYIKAMDKNLETLVRALK